MATLASGKKPRNRLERGKQCGPLTTVQFGSAAVPIHESRSKGRVRHCFTYYGDGRRLRQFFADLEAAKKEARFVAQRIQSGMQHVTDLKPHERDSYVRAVELLAEFDMELVAARSRDGASRSYLANLRAVLKRFSTASPRADWREV